GRVDFQVKIDGYRIELGEIEAALAEHPEVREAVVIAIGNGQDRRQLMAYVVPSSREHLTKGTGIAANHSAGYNASLTKQIAEDRDVDGSRLSSARIDVASSKSETSVLTDPSQRIEFKLAQRGLRQIKPGQMIVDLPKRHFEDGRATAYQARH